MGAARDGQTSSHEFRYGFIKLMTCSTLSSITFERPFERELKLKVLNLIIYKLSYNIYTIPKAD